MNNLRVLLVDDDPKIRKLMRFNLEQRGFVVHESQDGAGAIRQIQQQLPDLVLLDLVMPGGVSGNDVCSWIRERYEIPIIVISAHDEEDLKVRALDSGADDFVTKPFGHQELLARIRAVMRRSTLPTTTIVQDKICVAGLLVNFTARRAFVGEQDLRLTRTEFALLAELALNANAILTHDELLARVWGDEYRGSSHYLHVYFGRIRKKIGSEHSGLLESVPGIGYILHTELKY